MAGDAIAAGLTPADAAAQPPGRGAGSRGDEVVEIVLPRQGWKQRGVVDVPAVYAPSRRVKKFVALRLPRDVISDDWRDVIESTTISKYDVVVRLRIPSGAILRVWDFYGWRGTLMAKPTFFIANGMTYVDAEVTGVTNDVILFRGARPADEEETAIIRRTIRRTKRRIARGGWELPDRDGRVAFVRARGRRAFYFFVLPDGGESHEW